MRAELSLEGSGWRLAGYKGNGPGNLITGAETAAVCAGQQLRGEKACDWWLDCVRLWQEEHGSGNLEALDAAFRKNQGKALPPGPLRLGKYFRISQVFLSSADYCLQWANRAYKEQPANRAEQVLLAEPEQQKQGDAATDWKEAQRKGGRHTRKATPAEAWEKYQEIKLQHPEWNKTGVQMEVAEKLKVSERSVRRLLKEYKEQASER